MGDARPDAPTGHCSSLTQSQCALRGDCHWVTQPGFPGPISMCKACDEVLYQPTFIPATDGLSCRATEPVCLTTNSSLCPKPTPLPPDYCKDGTRETVANYTIASTDGQLCKIPKIYCLSKDINACPARPQIPNGYCKDGTIVDSLPKYVPSTDGKTCKVFEYVCLSKNPAACP
jgi:hypothetical protein